MWRHYKGSEFTLDSATGSVPILYPMHSDAERESDPHRQVGPPDCPQSRCAERPDTPSSGWRGNWLRWAFLVLGLVSLAWFLVRVLPKPRRAAYPCQRVAAPLAGSFLAWLGAIFLTTAVWKKGKALLRRFRYGAAAACFVLAAALALFVVIRLPTQPARADAPEIGSPFGKGKGIHPGRVVWVHAPEATPWDGVTSGGQYWWQEGHTDGVVVEKMFSQGIKSLTGQSTTAAAWDALFRHFNETSGRGYTGYTAGEKIAVKLNLVSCIDTDTNTHIKATAALNRIDPAPQMVCALLRHLVATVGVAQADITLGDPTSVVPDYYWNMVHTEFPNVHWIENPGGAGRERAEFSSVPVYWSTNAADGKSVDYLPVPFADADYIINFALLKWHTCGITLCGKNLYGSLIRTPDGNLRGIPAGYYDMHLSLPNAGWSPGTGHYRAIVDLMGHPQLGGKTILYLIDGLFSGVGWNAQPHKWHSPPFGDGVSSNWPSSLFMSQDPVAIDSVAHDFLLAEWPAMVKNGQNSGKIETPWPTETLQGGEEDYLHEAALADNPPSGTFYDSDRNGTRMASLGVHEHWNNSTNKQYSRNLGMNEGIELVAHTATSTITPEPQPNMRIQAFAATNAFQQLSFRSLTPGVSYAVQDCTSLLNNGWTNIGTFTADSHEMLWSWNPSNQWNTIFYRLNAN